MSNCSRDTSVPERAWSNLIAETRSHLQALLDMLEDGMTVTWDAHLLASRAAGSAKRVRSRFGRSSDTGEWPIKEVKRFHHIVDHGETLLLKISDADEVTDTQFRDLLRLRERLHDLSEKVTGEKKRASSQGRGKRRGEGFTPRTILGNIDISEETLREAAKEAGVTRPRRGEHGFEYSRHDISRIARVREKTSEKPGEIEEWNTFLREIGEPELGSKLKAKPKPKPK